MSKSTPESGASSTHAPSSKSASRGRRKAPAPQSYRYGNREFLNRELTWLEFNRRVLHEALDDRTPLLERVMFLSIFTSNLDEFFQKRVGGLKRQVAAGVTTTTPEGMSPHEQLAEIRRVVLEMIHSQAACFENELKPRLAEHGIRMLKWADMSSSDCEFANEYFRKNLFPVLTPLAVDPGHPFPFISNLSTSLAVMLRDPEDDETAEDVAAHHFARVKVPSMLPQFVQLPATDDEAFRFVHIADVITANLGDLFAGMVIEDVMLFRISRNADIEHDEEDAEDLLEVVENELRSRRFAKVIRLEVPAEPHPKITRLLMEELRLEEADIYLMPSELDFTDLNVIYGVNLPELKFESWQPAVPSRLLDVDADIFSLIRQGDILVHHPYEAFSASVERFIRAAASDPDVIAIKQTLYRTSSDSPFIPELIRAAESGKQVACLVELKARFDEERNIGVAQQLEKAGVHVVYGILGYKTHTKTSLVVRREGDSMRSYAHIGTGNYNSKTALLYTDLGIFTCNTAVTHDIIQLFHFLTGHSPNRKFNKLLIAPINMKTRFYDMIDREIRHAKDWKARGSDPADPQRPHIIAKMNSLEDRGACKRLYEASNVGVKIDLIVRGFCCLRPGVKGMSENISVVSVIGRFLEHSRIFYFYNAGQSEYYIGSADWMYRNLNNRVECIAPIDDPMLQARLKHILDVMAADTRQAWDMMSDGTYVQRTSDPGATPHPGTHRMLMESTRREARGVTTR